MKKLIATVAAAAFAFGLVGCNKSPEGGTPGTKDSFTLKAPTMATSIKQGDRQTVNLTLDRGSDFKKTVKLEATAPKDLKVELSKKSIEAGSPGDVSMTITADKDAPLGEHIIKVTATPEAGTATSVDVKVKVEEGPK